MKLSEFQFSQKTGGWGTGVKEIWGLFTFRKKFLKQLISNLPRFFKKRLRGRIVYILEKVWPLFATF